MKNEKAENRGIDQELFSMLRTFLEEAPVFENMGISLVYLGKGTAGIKASVKKDHTFFSGRLHGGIIATLADTAMGWAVGTLGQADQNTVTVDMMINYFIPVFQGNELMAEGYIIYAGNKSVAAEVNLFSNGKLVAKGRGTFFLVHKTDLNDE